MNALRTCASVLAVAVSFVLVGCGNETIGEDEQDQTSATTFSASVTSAGSTDNGGASQPGARQVMPSRRAPVTDQTQFDN